MSIREYLDTTGKFTISQINCNNLQCNTINNLIPNSGGGGGISNITSSDNSVSITNTNGVLNLTNAGQLWSHFLA